MIDNLKDNDVVVIVDLTRVREAQMIHKFHSNGNLFVILQYQKTCYRIHIDGTEKKKWRGEEYIT